MSFPKATEQSKAAFGENAYAEIPLRGAPTVGVIVGEQKVVLGYGITFEEAIASGQLHMAARGQVRLLYPQFGEVCVVEDGTCVVALRIQGVPYSIGRAVTFVRAFERAARTPAAKHQDQIQDCLDGVTRRFGSMGKVSLNEHGDVFVHRDKELMGVGCSFEQALGRAIAKDNQQLDADHRMNHPAPKLTQNPGVNPKTGVRNNRPRFNKRQTRGATAPSILTVSIPQPPNAAEMEQHEQALVGALELSSPADDPSANDIVVGEPDSAE